jgi:hypothetical protein
MPDLCVTSSRGSSSVAARRKRSRLYFEEQGDAEQKPLAMDGYAGTEWGSGMRRIFYFDTRTNTTFPQRPELPVTIDLIPHHNSSKLNSDPAGKSICPA